VLEQLGAGGMGQVYLCSHLFMRRLVAIKVLPLAKVAQPSSLARFYREARAAAALDHPNIVRAYDSDQEGDLHFLVMEYVDGPSLQQVVHKHGPLAVSRATHYIRQAALGLQHLHETGLVHRDIKPSNILVDRQGTVKILDLGLSRFFHDQRDMLTRNLDDHSILGTADYLAPEQALDSHEVDIRADIYSLGATFYFLLTGRPLFQGKGLSQKLLSHQFKEPTPLRELRPEVPEELAAVIGRMMAKDPAARYPVPAAVVEALDPWTEQPVPPPPEEEMPRLCLAARRAAIPDSGAGPIVPATAVKAAVGAAAPQEVGTPNGFPADAPAALAERGPWAAPASDTSRPSSKSFPPKSDTASGNRRTQETAAHPVATGTDFTFSLNPSPPTPARSRRPLVILGVTALVAGALGGGLLAWFLSRAPEKSSPPPINVVSRKPPPEAGGHAETNAAPKPPPVPGQLVVTRTGEKSTFRTVRDALLKAQPGDRILVRDDIHEEQLALDAPVAAGLTIEGKTASGRPVNWTLPPNSPSGEALLKLAGAPGLRVKGFHFQGKDRVHDLLTLTGPCPGFTLEGVELRGFVTCAVKLVDCTGQPKKPLALVGVRFMAGKGSEAALAFQAGPGATGRYISVRDCRFEGPVRAAVRLAGAVADVQLLRNRFFQADAGVVFKKVNPSRPVRLGLVSNTFCDLQKGLYFEAVPDQTETEIVMLSNLFARTKKLAQLESFSPEPENVRARWVWFDEGKPPRDVPVGRRYFRKSFKVYPAPGSRALLDIACDRNFTVWLNGKELGRGEFQFPVRRVHTFDVTRLLRRGANVLAVEGTNRLRPDDKRGPAGLLAQLSFTRRDNNPGWVVTDRNWKVSRDKPEGWLEPDFDDSSWPGVKVLTVYGKGNPTWRNLVWDSVVRQRFPDGGRPIGLAPRANIRDRASAEGFPLVESRARDFTLPTNPDEDAHFLRYPKDSPLNEAGPAKLPVGVPPVQE
jgi:serine/threonine protein kinase